MYRYANRTLVATLLLAMATGCGPDRGGAESADGVAALHAQAAYVWQTRAPVPSERTEVSVTTDGTRVYLIGGFAAGVGDERASAPRTMHVYDPATDVWADAGEIPEGVNHAGFVHHDGRLYIVGGFRENTFEPVGAVRIYDIATGRWSEGAPMPTPRGALAVAVLDGRIHAIGGNAADAGALAEHQHHVGEDDSSVGTHEVYHPGEDAWSRRAPMPTARNHHGAAAIDGRIHVIGGRVGRNFELTTHEVYEPETDSWSERSALPTGRSGIAVVARPAGIYVFGGETFTEPARTFADAERFDIATDSWQRLPPMPTARHGLGAAAVRGSIHVLSGGPGPGFTFSRAHEVLVPTTGSGDNGADQEPLEPFVGITNAGTALDGLFTIRSTGVSTEPIRLAADRFLGGLSDAQQTRARFAVDSDEWRRWTNVSRAARAGVGFDELDDRQRTLAFELLRESLSAKGLEQTRNIMRLNGHLAELLNNHDAYGEHLYWLVVFGEPSATEPWGWQLEGHHLIINYFVLGDQVVMTPTFMGSEPVTATTGRYAGTAVLQDEQARGVALMRALDAGQQARATLATSKPGNNALAQAYRDNLVLDYAGIRATELSPAQRTLLVELIGEFVGNMREGHARVRMEEVEQHLDDTYFAWIGGTGDADAFYFRVHSPVILIEFDHQLPVALRAGALREPTRAHIHSIVRTPNGNDYGRDLLRQHYERHRHDPSHGHGY